MSSLPVPDSPRINTVLSVSATLRMRSKTRVMAVALAHHVGKAVTLAQLFFKLQIFPFQAMMVQSPGHHQEEFGGIHRLGQVIVGSLAHGGHGAGDGAVAGDDYAGTVGPVCTRYCRTSMPPTPGMDRSVRVRSKV